VSLLERTEAGKTPVRLVGVGITQLAPAGSLNFEQPDLPIFVRKKL
jgi:hypothetical protein